METFSFILLVIFTIVTVILLLIPIILGASLIGIYALIFTSPFLIYGLITKDWFLSGFMISHAILFSFIIFSIKEMKYLSDHESGDVFFVLSYLIPILLHNVGSVISYKFFNFQWLCLGDMLMVNKSFLFGIFSIIPLSIVGFFLTVVLFMAGLFVCSPFIAIIFWIKEKKSKSQFLKNKMNMWTKNSSTKEDYSRNFLI